MKWKDEYAIGIEPIDEQHKMLFKMVADFQEVHEDGKGEKTYGLFLGTLATYTRSHFNIEEQCMEQHRCPVAEKNKTAHTELTATISGFLNLYHTLGYNNGEACRLLFYLQHWLDEHICRVDIHLKKCVNA